MYKKPTNPIRGKENHTRATEQHTGQNVRSHVGGSQRLGQMAVKKVYQLLFCSILCFIYIKNFSINVLANR